MEEKAASTNFSGLDLEQTNNLDFNYLIETTDPLNKDQMTPDPGEPNTGARVQYIIIRLITKLNSLLTPDKKKRSSEIFSTSTKNDLFKIDRKRNLETIKNLIHNITLAIKLLCKNSVIKDQIVSGLENSETKQLEFTCLLDKVRSFIILLNLYNYIEESLSVEKNLKNFLHKLTTSNRVLLRNAYKLFDNLLPEKILLSFLNIAYCLSQLDDIKAAAVVISDAFEYFAEQEVLNNPSLAMTHLSILALYHLRMKNIEMAEYNIEQVTLLPDEVKKCESLFKFTDFILIHVFNELGTFFLRNSEYEKALIYFEHESSWLKNLEDRVDTPIKGYYKTLCPRLISITPDEISNSLMQANIKIESLKKLVFKRKRTEIENLIKALNLNKILNKCIFNDSNFTMTWFFKEAEYRVAQNYLKPYLESSDSNSITIELNKANLDNFENSCKEMMEEPIPSVQDEKEKKGKSKKDKKDFDRDLTVENQNVSTPTHYFSDLISTLSPKRKVNRIISEKSLEDIKVQVRYMEELSVPLSVEWKNTKFLYNEIIYPLSKPPYIPKGSWFAILNELFLSELCKRSNRDSEKIMPLIKNILERGLLTSYGEGIKFYVKKLIDADYCCKIYLSDTSDKNDIQVYGRIIDSVVDRAEHKTINLICFDHIEFHKREEQLLPNQESLLRVCNSN
jgi:hypothetical protein